MGKINIIVAIDQNNAIGFKNDVLFKLKDDFKIFKQKTTGSTIVMGSKTFESIGSRPLPNRKNIVITRNKDYIVPDNVIVSNDITEILSKSKDFDIWVIGGTQVYKFFEKYADEMHITHIHYTAENADTFYNPNLSLFNLSESKDYIDENTQIKYTISIYKK